MVLVIAKEYIIKALLEKLITSISNSDIHLNYFIMLFVTRIDFNEDKTKIQTV